MSLTTQRSWRTLWCMAGLLVLWGCDRQGSFNVTVVNGTSGKIRNAVVKFDTGFEYPIGNCTPKDAMAVYGIATNRVPKKATVRWDTPDGVSHTKEVVVRDIMPAGSLHEIIFRIQDGENVVVSGAIESKRGNGE